MLEQSGIDYQINGDQEHCVDHTLNIRFCGVSSEALMLSVRPYCAISNGSACTTNDYSPSYVLTAMGMSPEKASESIRISWGASINEREISFAFQNLLASVKRFAQ